MVLMSCDRDLSESQISAYSRECDAQNFWTWYAVSLCFSFFALRRYTFVRYFIQFLLQHALFLFVAFILSHIHCETWTSKRLNASCLRSREISMLPSLQLFPLLFTHLIVLLFCSDYLFKLVLIGDSGVGKSCLLLRFAVRLMCWRCVLGILFLISSHSYFIG